MSQNCAKNFMCYFYLYVYIFLYIYVYVCVYRSIHAYVYTYICVYVYIDRRIYSVSKTLVLKTSLFFKWWNYSLQKNLFQTN
jgi:hypothetical protein